MKKFLQWLGGADPEVLDRVPSAGNTTAGLGGTVLTTAVMATAAFTMATHDWLHVPLVLALIVGIGWGFAILNLDRWLLMASRRQASMIHTVALAVPRLLLALVIGFVIAEPLVLRIYESEVTLRAKQDRQEEKTDRERELDRAFADIPKLESRQTKLQTTLASGPTVMFAGNADYDAARKIYDDAQEKLAKAQRAVGCEAQGTCGTGKAGCGPVCQANRRVAAQRQREADRAEHDLNAVVSRLGSDGVAARRQSRQFATPELARVNRRLRERRDQKDEQLAAITSDYKAPNAPLGAIDRMEALDHLGDENAIVGWSTWLFRLFLIAVDITPILFKTLLLTGRPSPYERAQKEFEKREHNRLKATEDAEDKAHDIQLKLITDEAKIQVEHRRRALREMHQKIAETEKEVWRQQIEDWRDAVHASNAGAGNGAGPAGGGNGSGGAGAPPPATTHGASASGSRTGGGAPRPGGRFQRGTTNGTAPTPTPVTPATANTGTPSWLTQVGARLRSLAGALRRPAPQAPAGQ